MDKVKVEKGRLIAQLKENKETHVADFELAWEGYQKAAIENLQEMLAAAKDPKKLRQISININLERPYNHEDDYEQAIQMLDWELGDEIELQDDEFRRLVMDDWNWKRQFTTSNTLYAGSASPSKTRR